MGMLPVASGEKLDVELAVNNGAVRNNTDGTDGAVESTQVNDLSRTESFSSQTSAPPLDDQVCLHYSVFHS